MKLSRIVIGTDFSGPSIEAARWTALHLAPLADLVVVHAVDVPRPPAIVRGRFPPTAELVENARRGAEARFAELGGWIGEPRVSTEVVEGPAAEVLVEAADLHAADLLVVGAHGGRPGLWDALGTTAERVVERAAVPVLVARNVPVGPPRRILVAVDTTDEAERELAWARFLADRLDAEVTVVHTVAAETLAPVEAGGLATLGFDVHDAKATAERWLDAALPAAGFDPAATDVRIPIGEPAHEVLAAAAWTRADLVVMGSRGAGPLAGALGGGVTRTVLRRAVASVFLVGPLSR